MLCLTFQINTSVFFRGALSSPMPKSYIMKMEILGAIYIFQGAKVCTTLWLSNFEQFFIIVLFTSSDLT